MENNIKEFIEESLFVKRVALLSLLLSVVNLVGFYIVFKASIR